MDITEVRTKLIIRENDPNDRRPHLLAFFSVAFDNEFVVHDLKLVEGDKGRFVAMPSRRATSRCQECRHECAVTDHYCGWCGIQLSFDVPLDRFGRRKLYYDLAHPTTADMRRYIEDELLDAYDDEKGRLGNVLLTNNDVQVQATAIVDVKENN